MVVNAVEWIDQRFYPEYGAHWDDELFRRRIIWRLEGTSVVLDLGAGSGRLEQMNVREYAARVCGIDTDPGIEENPHLDEYQIADATSIPYPDGEFDVVFANNVLEHLAEPERVFTEVRRTLKPGGSFLFKTPNRRHYVSMIARLTPHSFHEWLNSRRGRRAADTHPTLYRVNTSAAVRQCAAQAGLEVASIEHVEGRPEYLRFNGITYMAGLMYERLVNEIEMLAPFRVLLIGQLRAPRERTT